MTPSIAIVGASLAGLSAARALRARGFPGPITLIGDEPHLPYERPALSKQFLHTGEPISLLEDHSETTALDAEWLLGHRAIDFTPGSARTDTVGATAGSLADRHAGTWSTTSGAHRVDRRDEHPAADGSRHVITLEGGGAVVADIVVLATGARARRFPDLPGAHYLRNLDDAARLHEMLRHTRKLAIIGAGFIGAEVAAAARELGVDVTLIDAAAVPGSGALGESVASACAALHARHGVRLLTATRIEAVLPGAVHLVDGQRVAADAVLVGIGSLPNTEWASSANPLLHSPNGFPVDHLGRTAIPGVYAIGDCARVADPVTGGHSRTEHWHAAIAQANTIAAEITGTAPPPRTAPYFWSHQYGKLLQLAGDPSAATGLRVIDGALDDESFTVLYELDDIPVAVCALDNPRLFTRHRKQLDRALAAVH
ncbi:NAD(P)/FAD-dependent oxidoreductase [Nocardia sp. NPDC056000]|uniref:NAD(P)/FAD-dependent oxidoreductase n=1 Tax=Nocardia sp. NPDC056000 TaxID=3345674 RepID=UPI0035DC4C14